MQGSHSSSVDDHHDQAHQQEKIISVAVVTVSDTRTDQTDQNGRYFQEQLEHIKGVVTERLIVQDEPSQIEKALATCVQSKAQVIIFNGGTGISRRDRTFDVLAAKLEKPLPGFGELFRSLSYQEIGSAAFLSRATAGVYQDKVVFVLPGSPNAVRLAWSKLIAPELKHLAWELTR